MAVKDYYKILELAPNAGAEEIKRNFRQLALRFHPDTNQGRKHADAWYREIQEAYQVLSDPKSKAKYLQDRWLLKSKGIPFDETYPLTPEFIELRFETMRRNVSYMDHFRMDHSGLQKQLIQLANDDTIDALQSHQEDAANGMIINHLFYCMDPLEYRYISPLKPVLMKIAGNNVALQNSVSAWYLKRKRLDWWDRKQGWIIAIITLLLCGGIAFFANFKMR